MLPVKPNVRIRSLAAGLALALLVATGLSVAGAAEAPTGAPNGHVDVIPTSP